MIGQTLEQLQVLYRDLDDEIAPFRRESGLNCVPSCGACCMRSSQEITATILEMLPLALELLKRQQAQDFHTRALNAGSQGRCILFETLSESQGLGRCTFYDFRPLVCRLFGFAGVKDKLGRPVLTASRIMKEKYPKDVKRAQTLIDQGLTLPLYTHWAPRLQALAPELTDRTFSLNQAIAQAIEWAALRDLDRPTSSDLS